MSGARGLINKNNWSMEERQSVSLSETEGAPRDFVVKSTSAFNKRTTLS